MEQTKNNHAIWQFVYNSLDGFNLRKKVGEKEKEHRRTRVLIWNS